MPEKRPRLYVAQSYDARARTGIVVVELRGSPSRVWEHVVQRPAPPAALVDLGLAVARDEQLRDFELFLTTRLRPPSDELRREFGQLRVRWVARRKNLSARKLAHVRLRERVPGPPTHDDGWTLADYGVDLEIAGLVEAALDGQPAPRPRYR